MANTLRIEKNDENLDLHYFPESPLYWLSERLKHSDDFVIGKVFHFKRSDIDDEVISLLSDGDIEDIEEPLVFRLGALKDDYYQIPGVKLGASQDIYFHKNMRQSIKNFRGVRQASIFKQISALIDDDIFIGGGKSTSISEEVFYSIISQIPNEYELQKYISARISSVLRNYIDSKDAVTSYKRYMEKKPSRRAEGIRSSLASYEKQKYTDILSKLSQLLNDENQYKESVWQEEIKDILLLIYPQYIAAFREAPVFDAKKNKTKRVDYLLVDAGGNVDLLELKQPFDMAVVTRSLYRDNHIPLRELSGSIMQVEKYLYYLIRSGSSGESRLNKKFKNELPPGMSLKVNNPKGLVLLGRDNNLTETQVGDFDVIRRKYKNVVDILTYDDLVRRLENTINQIS